MNQNVKTIAILTSGGDAPGMNATVRAIVRSAIAQGLKVKGIQRGYAGSLNHEIMDMTSTSVSEIIHRGGTILLTARCKEFVNVEVQKHAADILRSHEIDALVVIGGDGSYRGALGLARQGINVIGIPATIDLDIACTEYAIGFDTAVNTALDAIDRIRDTSSSHERCSIVEVMGRSAGYIAICCGISSGAEEVLLPETYDGNEQAIIDRVLESKRLGKRHHLIINAEGVGHSSSMAKRIEEATGVETRATILGYLQRGGSPTCRDRFMGALMGTKAIDLLLSGVQNRVISVIQGDLKDIDIEEALAMKKQIPADWERISKLLVR